MKQIITIGGGGFSTGTEPGLDTYLLDQTGVKKPRIGFIGTASGDAESYQLRFYNRFAALDCVPSHLPLFRRTPNIANWVGDQDIIFVGGGNTKSMLATWGAWGIPAILKQALDDGTILSGISAGAICWFESGLTDSMAVELGPLECLGFLQGSCCPHYSLEKEREPTYKRLVAKLEMPRGFAIDDGAAIHFIDGLPAYVVSATDGATAYVISPSTGSTVSESLTNVEVINVSLSSGPSEA